MTSTNDKAKAIGSVLDSARVFAPVDTSRPGEHIVLVHGSMDRQAGFVKLAKILSKEHSVTVYDRRGYASSTLFGGPFDIAQHVRDLVDVIGSTPAILIGHSFGGTVSLACAQLHPELVRGVVVYENPMPWLEWWPHDTGAGHAARHGHDTRGAAEAFLIRFIGRRLWDRLPQSTKEARRAEGEALVGELSSIHDAAAFDRDLIHAPLVVGVGTVVKDYMRRGADYLAEKNDARLIVLEGAHHNAHSAAAGEFAERLVGLLLERLETGAWPRTT